MTIGEKVRAYREQLDLPREELAQKLRVSSETIRLWEKGQSVPTMDDLPVLKEALGVSADDIIGDEILPKEAYQFCFDKTEMDEIYRMQNRFVYDRPVRITLLCVLLVLFFSGSAIQDIAIYIAAGIFLFNAVSTIKGARAYKKDWQDSVERICKSVYVHKIFEDHISVAIYREDEKIFEAKCRFEEIAHIQPSDKWLFLHFGGHAFILRKSDLKENSAFYSHMYKNPTKITEVPMPTTWNVLSILLFVASLLSFAGAGKLFSALSLANGLFVENSWVYFLFAPIPIASIVLGYILKAKGYKYKKNIVVGIIMTLLLGLNGSFIFTL